MSGFRFNCASSSSVSTAELINVLRFRVACLTTFPSLISCLSSNPARYLLARMEAPPKSFLAIRHRGESLSQLLRNRNRPMSRRPEVGQGIRMIELPDRDTHLMKRQGKSSLHRPARNRLNESSIFHWRFVPRPKNLPFIALITRNNNRLFAIRCLARIFQRILQSGDKEIRKCERGRRLIKRRRR